MDYFRGLGISLLGVAMFFKPLWFWKIEVFFKMREGQPGDMYLNLMRFGGVAFLIYGMTLVF